MMATPMTLKQEKFQNLLAKYREQADIVPVQCDGLMEFVEHGDLDGQELDDYFAEKLSPVLTDDTESIVLGCTHYPFLKKELRHFLGDRDIHLIDALEPPANSCAASKYKACCALTTTKARCGL